jgi:hypothetical protein
MGLEPTTFCMASRRSSQLSYIRTPPEYSHGIFGGPHRQKPVRALLVGAAKSAPSRLQGVEGLVHEPVCELVVLPADGRVADRT